MLLNDEIKSNVLHLMDQASILHNKRCEDMNTWPSAQILRTPKLLQSESITPGQESYQSVGRLTDRLTIVMNYTTKTCKVLRDLIIFASPYTVSSGKPPNTWTQETLTD